jgi:hypothetical protein
LGQCDYIDAVSVLSSLPELKELNLVSLVDPEDIQPSQALPIPSLGFPVDSSADVEAPTGVTSPPMPTSPTGMEEMASIVRLSHSNLTALTLGGIQRPLTSLTVAIPTVAHLAFVCPMKVAALDLSACLRMSSLAFDAPPLFTTSVLPASNADKIFSTIPLYGTATMTNLSTVHSSAAGAKPLDPKFLINRLDFPSGSSSILKDVWLHFFKIPHPMLFNIPSLTHFDIGDVGKYQSSMQDLPALSISGVSLQVLRVDLSGSSNFDVVLSDTTGAQNLVELSLSDVYLGNRQTAERKAGMGVVGTQIVQKKTIPLFLLQSLESEFPNLTKLLLRFDPVNLYLTSLASMSHSGVQEVSLENLPLENLDTPNVHSLSYGVQSLDSSAFLDSLSIPGKFFMLTRLSLHSVQAGDHVGFAQLAIPSLVELNLNLPVLPVAVQCPNIRFLRLGHRCYGVSGFLLTNLQSWPQIEEMDVYCDVPNSAESVDSMLALNHPNLRILRFHCLLSVILSLNMPSLEELVIRSISRDFILQEAHLPKLKVVTVPDATLKDKFSSPFLRRVIVPRDPRVSTRSQSKRM